MQCDCTCCLEAKWCECYCCVAKRTGGLPYINEICDCLCCEGSRTTQCGCECCHRRRSGEVLVDGNTAGATCECTCCLLAKWCECSCCVDRRNGSFLYWDPCSCYCCEEFRHPVCSCGCCQRRQIQNQFIPMAIVLLSFFLLALL